MDSAQTLGTETHEPWKPKVTWAGDHLLSRLVNVLIGIPPVFSLMKVMAKAVIKQGAEKRGVPWGENVRELEATPEVYAIKEELEDKSVQYPDYYLQQFHGYDEGNLNWLAAFEVESATYAMHMRSFKLEPDLSPVAAREKGRGGVLTAIQDFQSRHAPREICDILDVGCSSGVGTRFLAEKFPEASTTGLDLSPYFLSVGELRERQLERRGALNRKRIRYMHAVGERTGLPAASFDFVSMQYVIHECRAHAIAELIAECRRLLRPGGVFCIVDNDPRSPVLQRLPPALFTLMKSTEPWSDEYYPFDVEAEMRSVGLQHVVSVPSDPRHRAVLGMLPHDA